MAAMRPGTRGLRYDAIHCVGGLSVDGDSVLGADETATITCNATLLLRQVNDAGMNATPGTLGEVVYNLDDSKVYFCTATHAVAATWANADIAGAAAIVGALECGGTLTVTGNTTLQADLDVGGNADITGDLDVDGNTTLGTDASNSITCLGALLPRQVNDAGMAASAGTEGEIVYNLADDTVYVCTATDPAVATWDALN